MMPTPNYLYQSVTDALRYADENGIEIPISLRVRARQALSTKASGDLGSINSAYNDAIVQALVNYFDGGALASSRNAFKRAMVEAFGSTFDTGTVDGGGELPFTGDALDWFNARVSQESGYIDLLFAEAKQLKKEKGFDYFAWATARADGYVNTLREIYNVAKMMAMSDKMVTFEGDDGAESCDTCQKLKGKRHKISWFVARGYVPPFGVGLDCHPGRRCQHYLVDDNGDIITI